MSRAQTVRQITGSCFQTESGRCRVERWLDIKHHLKARHRISRHVSIDLGPIGVGVFVKMVVKIDDDVGYKFGYAVRAIRRQLAFGFLKIGRQFSEKAVI
jgi:hypothetical protein